MALANTPGVKRVVSAAGAEVLIVLENGTAALFRNFGGSHGTSLTIFVVVAEEVLCFGPPPLAAAIAAEAASPLRSCTVLLPLFRAGVAGLSPPPPGGKHKRILTAGGNLVNQAGRY